MTGDPTGLLIIRAWIEEGSSEPLRAQVRISTDTSGGFERTLTFTRPEQVCATIEQWLVAMVAGTKDPEPELS